MTVGADTVDFEYDSDGDTVDDSDFMTKIGDDSLGWNSNGNLDNSVTAAFVYDWDNKLKYAVGGENAVEIRYDLRGNRIYKGVYDTQGKLVKERKYIVDIVGKLPVILCEIDPNTSSLTNKYYYANSQILAQDAAYLTDPNSVEYDRYIYQHDRLGSVRQVLEVMPIPDLHWRFDEASGVMAYDSRGFGVTDANLVGGISRITGKYQGGIDLDGIDDYLWTAGDPNDDGSGSHTYSAWVRTTDSNGTVMCWGDPQEYGGVLGVYDSSGNGVIGVSVQSVTDQTTGYIMGSTNISDGQWHHVAAVVADDDTTDVSEIVLYVDGNVETISVSSPLSINAGGNPLLTGAVGYPGWETVVDPNDSNEMITVPTFTEAGAYPAWGDPNLPNTLGLYFDGSIDELRVYDRLLSIGQIRKLAATENYIKVKNSYTYNPYGEDFQSECVPFKYTGQWYDSEIAQYYLRARQYDPQLMRFSGRDPVKGKLYQPMAFHKYLYCSNDPINVIDPSGRFGWSAKSIMGGVLAGTAAYSQAISTASYAVSTGNDNFFQMSFAIGKYIPMFALGGTIFGPVSLPYKLVPNITGGMVGEAMSRYDLGLIENIAFSTTRVLFHMIAIDIRNQEGITDDEMEGFNAWRWSNKIDVGRNENI